MQPCELASFSLVTDETRVLHLESTVWMLVNSLQGLGDVAKRKAEATASAWMCAC